MVPFLLQVWSQPANVRASLRIGYACKQSKFCAAVFWQKLILKNISAAPGRYACLERY